MGNIKYTFLYWILMKIIISVQMYNLRFKIFVKNIPEIKLFITKLMKNKSNKYSHFDLKICKLIIF